MSAAPVRSVIPAVLIASLASVGCAVGPDYQPPDPPTRAHFAAAAAVSERPISAAAPALSTWWSAFNDPLLTQVVTRALAQNLDIAQAVARVSQARAAVRGTRAALLPAAQATGNAATARQSREDALGRLRGGIEPGFDRDGETYDAGIGMSWELDLSGGLRRNAEAARADYQVAEAGRAAAQLTVAASTADTYVLVRTFQGRLDIIRQQTQTQQRLVDLVRLQYSRGVASELQLRQAEGALAAVSSTIPALEAGLEAELNALDVLMGAEPGTYRGELQAAGLIPLAPAVATAEGPADLLRRRPDIIAAERRLAASNARIGAAVSEYYPKLSVSGLIGTATMQSGNLFTAGAEQQQALAGLRWRLFDFGRVDAAVAAAKGRNAEALAAYRATVLQATADVENAFTALVKREAQARSLVVSEDALARARVLALVAYQGGAVSLIEVLDADDRLLRTQDARIQAQSDVARAAIASFKALGGGWET